MDSSKKHELCKEMCNTVDLICIKRIHKSLPHNVLKDIYDILYKLQVNTKNKNCTLEDDYNLISKGNVKKKWKNKNYETGMTKYRIKRAFSYGR